MSRVLLILVLFLSGCAIGQKLIHEGQTFSLSEKQEANFLFLKADKSGAAEIDLGQDYCWFYRDENGGLKKTARTINEQQFSLGLNELLNQVVNQEERPMLNFELSSVLPPRINSFLPASISWQALAGVAYDDSGDEVAVINSRLVLRTPSSDTLLPGPCVTLVQKLQSHDSFWDSAWQDCDYEFTRAKEVRIENDCLMLQFESTINTPVIIELWNFQGQKISEWIVDKGFELASWRLPKVDNKQLWVRIENGAESKVWPVFRQ